jgi:L-rhamnonate dehydratase
MPGDRQPRLDVATALQCARALEPLGVYWLEEPLPTTDLDGYQALRARTDLRLAAGEMVRTAYEARDLVLAGVDVVQPDIVLAGGFGGCRRIAAHAELHGRAWSPHTWSNGYGFLANLHGALGLSSIPFVEVPYDPPTWSTARRDFLLPAPIEMASDGTIAPPDGPGLGVVPDLDALEAYRVG